MNTIVAFFNLLGRIWDRVNRYFKIAVFIILAFPFFALLISLADVPWLTALLVVAVIVGAICYFNTVIIHPLLIVAVAELKGGKEFLNSIVVMLGLEVLFTIYCVMVPMMNNASLIPALLLVALALVLFSSNPNGGKYKKTKKILILLAVAITVSFFLPDLPRVAKAKIGRLNEEISKMEPKNSLVPVGGTMETPEERAEYAVAVKLPVGEPSLEGKSSLHVVSKELQSIETNFNYDNRVITFESWEMKKIIPAELLRGTSPIIKIGNRGWRTRLSDSVEVWPRYGPKYIDIPGVFHANADKEFRLTGRTDVTIERY